MKNLEKYNPGGNTMSILSTILGVISILMAIYLLCIYLDMPIIEVVHIMFIILFFAMGVGLLAYK